MFRERGWQMEGWQLRINQWVDYMYIVLKGGIISIFYT